MQFVFQFLKMLGGHRFTGNDSISIFQKIYADLEKTEVKRTLLHTRAHMGAHILQYQKLLMLAIHTHAMDAS